MVYYVSLGVSDLSYWAMHCGPDVWSSSDSTQNLYPLCLLVSYLLFLTLQSGMGPCAVLMCHSDLWGFHQTVFGPKGVMFQGEGLAFLDSQVLQAILLEKMRDLYKQVDSGWRFRSSGLLHRVAGLLNVSVLKNVLPSCSRRKEFYKNEIVLAAISNSVCV